MQEQSLAQDVEYKLEEVWAGKEASQPILQHSKPYLSKHEVRPLNQPQLRISHKPEQHLNNPPLLHPLLPDPQKCQCCTRPYHTRYPSSHNNKKHPKTKKIKNQNKKGGSGSNSTHTTKPTIPPHQRLKTPCKTPPPAPLSVSCWSHFFHLAAPKPFRPVVDDYVLYCASRSLCLSSSSGCGGHVGIEGKGGGFERPNLRVHVVKVRVMRV